MSGSDGLGSFFDPLVALEKLLSHYENRWVVIGGVAVSMLARPRFTEDLDAMVLLSVDEVDEFIEVAKRAGIEPRISEAEVFAKKNRVLLLRHVKSDTRIDISLGILPFEQELVERSKAYQVDDALQVFLPTPEDLIIMKSVANRPKDLEDIRTLVDKYPDLDKGRLEMWVKAFAEALEMPEIWNNLAGVVGYGE